LQQDTNVSEEHAAPIFKVEVCRFWNRPNYTGKLQERYSWYPRIGYKNGTWFKPKRRNEQKMALTRGTLLYPHR
jgi:hypothetical protein